MKIIVTGNTSGIGKSLSEEFCKRGHDVVGISRSAGFNISDVETQKRIVEMSADADMFVNNAHERFFQVEIFTRLWRSWRDQPKKIVNIGSIVNDMRSGPDSPQHPLGRAHYASEKAALEMASQWAWNDLEARCDVVLVKPGLVDTPRTTDDRIRLSKIDSDKMAKYIVHSVLDQPFVVRQLTIGNYRKNNA
jgi:NAD(P)-dependent dehydrogenase (short-subunit alcohol dehydrogenase family)